MISARTLAALAVTALGLAVVSSAAGGSYVYAGPKTWHQGWYEDFVYDEAFPWWVANVMADKSCYCYGRVAFIRQSDYAWVCSVTNNSLETGCAFVDYDARWSKKPLCKNNSSSVYTAYCRVIDMYQ